MAKVGEDYEKAVYEFIKTLDPTANVLFNHFVPDRDTFERRQCDVWVEAKFGGLLSMSIYISCKDHSRKLNSGDIDTFLGEMYSRSATNGVIYSKIGFTKPAIVKAEKHKISCCRIFINQPAELPRGFTFEHYVLYPRISPTLQINKSPEQFHNWNEFFNLTIENKLVLEFIEEEFNSSLDELIQKNRINERVPSTWGKSYELFSASKDLELLFSLQGSWRVYKAVQEATLYNGTYCLNDDGAYKGTITGPAIDTLGPNPGSHWKLVDFIDYSFPGNRIIALFHGGKIRDTLIEQIGYKPINS